MGKLKGKKKELDTANMVVIRFNNQLKDTKTEVTSPRAKVEQLERENVDLKKKN